MLKYDCQIYISCVFLYVLHIDTFDTYYRTQTKSELKKNVSFFCFCYCRMPFSSFTTIENVERKNKMTTCAAINGNVAFVTQITFGC